MSPVPPPTLATITASVTVEPAEPFHLHDALVRFPVKDARRTTAGALDFLLSYVVSLEEKVTNLEKRAEKAEERLNVERQKHAGEIETLRAELANVKSFSEALALDEHSVQKTVEVEQAERKKLARKIDDERKQTVDAFEAFRSQLADVQSKANTASTVPQSFRQMIETESADRILMGKEIRELAGNAEARAKKADDNVKSRYSELNQRMIKVNARATKTERDLLSAERKSTAAHKKTTDKTAALDSQLSQQNNDAIVEKARTEKLVRQVDDLSNEFNVFGSRLAQLSSAVSILEAKQATFSTTSAVLEAEPRTLQNQVHQVSKLGSQEAIVGNVIQHLGSTVAELKEGKQDLKTKYETISATAADLQAKHATLSATVNKLASKHGDSNDFVREIQATDLEAQLAVLNKFKADTERKLGKFEKNLHHKSGQIINVEQDIEALKKSMGKLERQNSEAPRQTATPRSSVSGTSGLKAEMQPIVIDD
ncbi:hypothetical protein H2203_003133 [Taxawa tesnikishii (nom. ined.)]|nr:hypothetical protein H2203_003133 [Dothideales sp. JES 119]